MIARVCRVLTAAAFVFAATTCGSYGLEPLPLDITIDVTPVSPAVGETVNFVVKAQGGTLVSLTIDYGDTITEDLGTAGARTARHTFSHSYTVAGTYDVQATVNDAGAGSKAAMVQIAVH